MVRYIHAADLHLDSPFKGLKNIPESLFTKIKASTFNALRNIVDAAIFYQVDFVLLAGDIYDIEDRSIRAQVLLRKELDRLNEAEIRVFLIHGNHDFLINDELHLTLPENVEVFGPNVETKVLETTGHERVAVSGFSYDRNWIEERKITEYPPRHRSCDYHIGILHGYMEGQGAEHARYAPFSLTELKEKNYDYWALGHIHKRQQLSDDPLVYYSGNTQGRHKNESGEKGCLLIELTKSDQDVTFIPTADIRWQTVELDVTDHKSINGIFDEIKKSLDNEAYTNSLVTLELEISEETPQTVISKLEDEAFYQVFQKIAPSVFVYIVSARIKVTKADEHILSLESSFPSAWNKALNDVRQEETFLEMTQELFSQHAYAKYTDENQEKIKNDCIEAAKHILMKDLGDEISYDN
ncbi:DNA repair exonuclease SbcCD nuclease subunit [Alkalibacterium subtropicum]|uniref:DNA repair exonuclease SbcCD nuclease subunit n=1 Tax=Alkalibacterium subtropicum TaxID=753702 RepID=A0A1I1E8E3_9LACT|nr:DNA repair exonuclease [Alkalibacterium subtropicum]SFB83337.1 DNA repair exonuclease SbcCD nuclease subunit [Alkalibacterium subtropicum]